jgi:hypothetical protein
MWCQIQAFQGKGVHKLLFKGVASVTRYFASGFFMNPLSPSPRKLHLGHFEFFRKFPKIFASQGAPPVSTTPVAN